MTHREHRLLPNGKPRYVRCYDDGGKSCDRYTVVFTGRYKGRNGCDYLGMSERPFHPQGAGHHGWSQSIIDQPTHGHLGRRIEFDDLPPDCQRLVLSDYKAMWRLSPDQEKS